MLVLLLLERAGSEGRYEEIALLPFKWAKTILNGKNLTLQAGANTVAENKCGSLDLARADPTAENESQYHIESGQWGKNFMHM